MAKLIGALAAIALALIVAFAGTSVFGSGISRKSTTRDIHALKMAAPTVRLANRGRQIGPLAAGAANRTLTATESRKKKKHKVTALRGPQGPQGLQGLQGPQGTQGPAGTPGGFSTADVIYGFTPVNALDFGYFIEATALCPAGKRVISGGVYTDSADSGVIDSRTDNGTSWTVTLGNFGTALLHYQTQAICA